MSRFESSADALEFIFAGKAIFTLHNEQTDKRFTYKLGQPDNVEPGKQTPTFVSYLTGPDNSSDYTYLGTIWEREKTVVAMSRKSPRGAESNPAKLGLEWLLRQLVADKPLPSYVALYHEGRCGRCGRRLTTPDSIRRGIGPECAGKMEAGL